MVGVEYFIAAGLAKTIFDYCFYLVSDDLPSHLIYQNSMQNTPFYHIFVLIVLIYSLQGENAFNQAELTK